MEKDQMIARIDIDYHEDMDTFVEDVMSRCTNGNYFGAALSHAGFEVIGYPRLRLDGELYHIDGPLEDPPQTCDLHGTMTELNNATRGMLRNGKGIACMFGEPQWANKETGPYSRLVLRREGDDVLYTVYPLWWDKTQSHDPPYFEDVPVSLPELVESVVDLVRRYRRDLSRELLKLPDLTEELLARWFFKDFADLEGEWEQYRVQEKLPER